MKSNKETLIKMLASIGCIIVIVVSINKLLGGNSMTLSEYAKQHPELAYKETVVDETEESLQKEDAAINNSANNVEMANGTETAPPETETSDVAQSNLLGASLNGTNCLEERFTYADSFYYEPLSDNLRRFITGISYPDMNSNMELSNTDNHADIQNTSSVQENSTLAITYDDLRYVHILHYDFNGDPIEGELICNEAIAEDMVEIFYELYRNEYRIEKVKLIDEYDGNDTASME